ncbi:putative cation-transporting ATPase 13A3 [Hypsibius exemplaris]|uniref:Cation-transporting ATPase n=1 Tax=Hypsibius exemplaris TaxID=2072580 RepID=A0A1W0WFA7_HYPEX|nr:putative cation-transporting ATPase 13A3 [Hypsibius exemplaris]
MSIREMVVQTVSPAQCLAASVDLTEKGENRKASQLMEMIPETKLRTRMEDDPKRNWPDTDVESCFDEFWSSLIKRRSVKIMKMRSLTRAMCCGIRKEAQKNGPDECNLILMSLRHISDMATPEDVWGYKAQFWKSVCFTLLELSHWDWDIVVLSWCPIWITAIKKTPCEVQEAESVLLKDSHGNYFSHSVKQKVLTRKPKLISRDVAEFGLLTSDPPDDARHAAKSLGLELLGKAALEAHLTAAPASGGGGGSPQPNKICTVRWFTHSLLHYAWHHRDEKFQRLSGLPVGISCGDLHSRRGGVSDEERQQKLTLFGPNIIDVEVKPVLRLLVEEILNPFYCFQVFCIILWSLDDYYIYASCVLVVSLFGICLSLYETRKQRLRLRQMVLKSTTSEKFQVLLDNGEFAERSPDSLVPGDVIVIPKHGCLMPCDAALIEGNCIVNEGVLTGESAPVTKVPLNGQDAEIFSGEEHKRHILFHGTTVIQTRFYEGARVLAVVCQTGFYTVKGDLVRSILFPKPIGFKFYRDALRLVGVMAVIAALGMAYSTYIYWKHGEGIGLMILRALDLITIVVPPALPAALTVGIVYSQRRLKKVGIFCISPSRINVCGKIKLVCFDKTGTLTEEGLDLMGVIPAVDGDLGPMVANLADLERQDPLLVGMASCHSLTMIDGKLNGDPLDLKLFEATDWVFCEPRQDDGDSGAFDSLIPTTVFPKKRVEMNLRDGFEKEEGSDGHVGIVKQFPFSSGLQRMAVVTRAPDDNCFTAFVKGSPEKIVSLSRPDSVPLNFHKTLHFYAHQGFRVIAMGYRKLDPKLAFHQMARLKREAVESELTFIGLLIMRNNLKPESAQVIGDLIASDIKTVMVTGDNMLTAISVGHDCGMIPKGDEVVIVDVLPPDERTSSLAHILWRSNDLASSSSDVSLAESDGSSSTPSRAISANEYLITMDRPKYHFAMTGRSFSVLLQHFPELVPKIMVRGTIFARFSPEQKTQLVEKYIDLEYITGMVGDGANDCGALKAAHAGISLSEAEASVASPFTSSRNTIECVPTVIKEGRCALVTSFGIFKYMALYSMVQFVAVLILYEKRTILADMHFLYLDMVITTIVAVLMGYTKPYDRLVSHRPHGSLMAPSMIVSIFSQMIIVVGFQTMAIHFLQHQSWYSPISLYDGPEDEREKVVNWEATLLFLVAAFQDLILAFVFSKGPPYRKRIYTNVLFLAAIVVLAFLTGTLLLYSPGKWLEDLMKVVHNPEDSHLSFRLAILGLMAANLFAAVAVEELIVDRVWFKRVLKTIRRKKHSKSAFKMVRRQLDKEIQFPPVGRTTYAKDADDAASSVVAVDAKGGPDSTNL